MQKSNFFIFSLRETKENVLLNASMGNKSSANTYVGQIKIKFLKGINAFKALDIDNFVTRLHISTRASVKTGLVNCLADLEDQNLLIAIGQF